MKIIRDIPYAEGALSSELDVYMPSGEASAVFLYFHGGGLEHGDKKSAERFADYLLERGIAVVSANYRMYPDASYPDFIIDAALAVKWTKRFIAETYPEARLFVGGSSAGGYISQMLCFDDSWLSAHEIKPSAIAGYLLDAGQPTCHFNVLRERGLDTRRVIIDETSPLYHIDSTQSDLPMLIIVSDNDMENRYEQTMLTLSTLRHFGRADTVTHIVMHGTHCNYVERIDDDGKSAFGKIILEFIGGIV